MKSCMKRQHLKITQSDFSKRVDGEIKKIENVCGEIERLLDYRLMKMSAKKKNEGVMELTALPM